VAGGWLAALSAGWLAGGRRQARLTLMVWAVGLGWWLGGWWLAGSTIGWLACRGAEAGETDINGLGGGTGRVAVMVVVVVGVRGGGGG